MQDRYGTKFSLHSNIIKPPPDRIVLKSLVEGRDLSEEFLMLRMQIFLSFFLKLVGEGEGGRAYVQI